MAEKLIVFYEVDIREMREFEIIDWIKENFSTGILLPIGDDAAIFDSEGRQIVISSDTIVNNIHFALDYFSFEEIGSKAIETACSDIVAMVCEPKYVLVNLVYPHAYAKEKIMKIYSGIKTACNRCSLELIGGDTCSGRELVISVTVIGFKYKDVSAVKRSGAQVGDNIYISGKLGASYLGLIDIQNSKFDSKYAKIHRSPKCRVDLLEILKLKTPTSIIDISDGLSNELNHLSSASNLKFIVEQEKIEKLKISNDMELYEVLNCGEDYELLYTGKDLEGIVIGHVVDGLGVYLSDLTNKLQVLRSSAFEHFR